MRAFENNCYVAVANMAGRDLTYSYFGHSNIVNFDGMTMAECGTAPDEVTYAELSLSAIRNARRNWTAENHLYNMLHRGFTSEPGGHAECCLDFYKIWATKPAEARALSEALTRDADAPEDATGPNVSVMAPSKLALATLGGGKAKGAVAANGHANGVANGIH